LAATKGKSMGLRIETISSLDAAMTTSVIAMGAAA
jgi:hypothetical protein